MYRKKTITLIVIICVGFLYYVYGVNTLDKSQNKPCQGNLILTEDANRNVTISGVGKISIDASLLSTILENGTHSMSVSLSVIEFYGACFSIIDIKLYLSILNHSQLYFNSVPINNLTEVGINESTELSFNYLEPWGNVDLYLRMVFTSVHTTGDEFIPHDSGWLSFYALSPIPETQETGNNTYFFMTLIAVLLLSSMRFFIYARNKKI